MKNNIHINNILINIATLGPVGYLSASGTMATLVTLPFILIPLNMWWYSLIGIALAIVAFIASEYAVKHFSMHDPSQIVIDEVVGCWVTFLAVPKTLPVLGIGFLLFRLFDILKWFGISRLEAFRGGWGVVLDDVVAGILSNLIVRLVM